MMASRFIIAAAGVLCAALPALPALASPCGDRIAALERRLEEGTARAAATSSGGQAVAAAREGQASQPGSRNEPTIPFQKPAQEAQATRQAAEAGGGGTAFAEARATLNQARTLDQQGNASGCLEAIGQAERRSALQP
ncbi:hypothetical protein [Teichococcus vastitatis]|jgi:hypothetical protein|uniref:Uncharacterized protein n=1 Tax=Teichococcus vastitatis TaxID=2307076 RepID=A0ABS9W602_9PROT|nr:hypothetical protein [Pseudoroseomonas vastitatis]MCI0754716.1 hypothetical protein [Pseudoroseomonas vastitatis]